LDDFRDPGTKNKGNLPCNKIISAKDDLDYRIVAFAFRLIKFPGRGATKRFCKFGRNLQKACISGF
jgi:hypothetical protein